VYTIPQYRQCAGRAGRRGHDLLGKVVFYGLAFNRVQRLVLSKLPSLGGNFPLTSTLVLRLLNLVEGSDSAPVAVNAVKSLITLPQVVSTSKEGGQQLLHHLRFSIEYLRRARLLDSRGKPMNLFGIAAHLYYTEPSNFALVALLRAGVLHKICANPSTVAAKHDFIMLMAHLFGRKYLPWAVITDENMKEIVRKSSSIVVLPRLDKRAREVLLAHERDILRIFASYALTYATQNSAQLGQDTQLPLSKIRYDGSPGDGGLFRRHLEKTSIPVVARSPFVANSGHDDHFESISELARTTRSGLYLNEHAIPSMSGIIAVPDEKDEVFELNAYIYDFYLHGQPVTLAKANGIRRGDIW
jgi:ATP-dependent RNA helicase DDX60